MDDKTSRRGTLRLTKPILWTVFFAAAILASCSKPAGTGQRAIVTMRDGTQVSGTVLSSSASQIELTGDDKATHTISMAQVRSIEYQDASSPQAAPSGDSSQPAPSAAATPSPEMSHQDHYHPTESAITTTTYELPAGTEISVRNEETIDSGKTVEGQTFPAEVTRDVLDAGGKVVIPHGANALIVIRSVSKGGKIRGASDLVLDLASVGIDGRKYEISTTDIAERGKSGIGENRRTGEFTGGGAVVGAIIGAIAGGGKGAAIGAGAGAGAGAATQVVTKGTIKVPVETILTFRLDRPLRVTAAS